MNIQAFPDRVLFAVSAEELMRPVPEVVLLLDAAGRILRASADHAGHRLSVFEFTVGENTHRALHLQCRDDDCPLESQWARAWEAHQQGLPVEWLTRIHDPEGIIKFRLQPVAYACGVLFEKSVEHFEGCSVAFIQDVTSQYDAAGQVQLRRAADHVHGKPLGLACDGHPCEMVSSIDHRLHVTAGRLLVAQESERKRIAAELHDGLGQTLSLLNFEIESLSDSACDPDPSGRRVNLERIRGHAQRSLAELRRITQNLRPLVLSNMGLYGALETLCADFRAACPEVSLDCELSGSEAHVPEDIGIAVYRIAQEALNNVAKHAAASVVSLALSVGESGVEMVVRDNGTGLPGDAHDSGGLGLEIMAERARILGGKFLLETSAGKGCEVRVCWDANSMG